MQWHYIHKDILTEDNNIAFMDHGVYAISLEILHSMQLIHFSYYIYILYIYIYIYNIIYIYIILYIIYIYMNKISNS